MKKNVDEMSVFEEYIHKTHTHNRIWMNEEIFIIDAREGEKEIKITFYRSSIYLRFDDDWYERIYWKESRENR